MRKRGFTLIEVAIALAIFVVGALAVIRIFPPAFNVVQGSGHSNVATRLSDSILTQMKNDGSMPDAIFDIDDSIAWNAAPIEVAWTDPQVSVVGTSTKNGSLPKGPTQTEYENSALMRYRFVRGEKHFIQNTDSTEPVTPPYILTNFPYDSSGGVNVYLEMIVNNVSMDSAGRLDFRRATSVNPLNGSSIQFNGASDSNTSSNYVTRPPEFLILTPGIQSEAGGWPNFPRVNALNLPLRSVNPGGPSTRYYVSYRWSDTSSGDNVQHGVVDEPLNLPDDSNWNNGDLNVNRVLRGVQSQNNTNIHVVAGSGIQVKVRVYLGIFDTSVATDDQANLGYVPLRVITNDGTVTGLPLMPEVPVYLDYLIPDHSSASPADQFEYGWRNILDDSVANVANEIFLPVNLLDNTAIKALAIDNTVSPNVVALPIMPSASPSSDFTLGKVAFAGSANAQVRTSYRGIDGWARQISLTSKSYVPYLSQAALMGTSSLQYPRNFVGVAPAPISGVDYYYLPREFWREYYWLPGSDTIYFHSSEAGKQVSVSFIDTTGKTWLNHVGTIHQTPVTTPNSDFAATYAAPLQFVDPANPNNMLAISSILGVRGMGVIARTAWLNGDKYEQSVVTGYRAPNAQ